MFFGIPSYSYFKNLGAGARPMGMGGAYTAVADDANAPFWNPSGLAQLEKHELTAMFSALYVGLDAKLYNEKTDQLGYHFICYAHPWSSGCFAISWSTFQSQIYDESIFCLSYGRILTESLYAGLNLKNMGWSVGENEFTRIDRDIPDHGVSIREYTIDLGGLYKFKDGLTLGFSAENLIPADVGLKVKERIPLNLRLGIAYKLDKVWYKDINLLPAMDIAYRSGEEANILTGCEAWLFDRLLGLRAGWNSTSITSGISCNFVNRLWEFQIDYAFTYPLKIQNTYGSHRMSLSVRF